jgi:hypothetical protein
MLFSIRGRPGYPNPFFSLPLLSGSQTAYTHITVSLSTFAAISILNGVSILFLPETKDKEIPDTLEDAENYDQLKPDKKAAVSPPPLTSSDACETSSKRTKDSIRSQ